MLVFRGNQFDGSGSVEIGGKINLVLGISGCSSRGSDLDGIGGFNPLARQQMVEPARKLGIGMDFIEDLSLCIGLRLHPLPHAMVGSAINDRIRILIGSGGNVSGKLPRLGA